MTTIPYDLIIFDLDGTLIESYLPDGNYNHIRCHPHVPHVLRDLHHHGVKLAVATNQAGVAYGHTTLSHAIRRTRAALDLAGLPDAHDTAIAVDALDDSTSPPAATHGAPPPTIYMAVSHPNAPDERWRTNSQWRKPNPGMLNLAMRSHRQTPHRTLFVGDQHSDQLAARNANIDFAVPLELFGPPYLRRTWAASLGLDTRTARTLPEYARAPYIERTINPEPQP